MVKRATKIHIQFAETQNTFIHSWHFVSAPGVDGDFQHCTTDAGEVSGVDLRLGSNVTQRNPPYHHVMV